MKFEIKNRYTGDVQFTAEIETTSKSKSIQMGLAVKLGVKNNANLSYANLSYANLSYADLSYADLRSANLRSADLSYADLSYADLSYADLRSAGLWGAIGNMKHVKIIQVEKWCVAYTSTDMQIGCERHPIAKWKKYRDATINKMDNEALAWWKIWKPIIFQIIETSPAEPTGADK